MRKFDPWPVFFKREFNRNWPFLVGFAITGTIITKFSLGLTEEDRKNSVFAQRHKRAVVPSNQAIDVGRVCTLSVRFLLNMLYYREANMGDFGLR
ncbi:hypothetical protein M8C21_024183 [Ambrosia artemisiifolia]|uniref:Uncharacterized protein n=1 Tax=Ambrosia artemisiifolia TaxID=4212 RepID=A0AAD5BZX5_AMBAR|nr:hypothetical protein M8C21_024183 [Ambrosia artemisiifolia]